MALSRFAINTGFLARPLVAGFLWAVLTNDYTVPINIAIFCELFWIDQFPIGTIFSPQSTFCLLATIILSGILGIYSVSGLTLILIFSMILANLLVWLEGRQRILQNRSYNSLLRQTKKGLAAQFKPEKLVLKSIVQLFCIYALFFIMTIYLLKGILSEIPTSLYHNPSITWPYLWIFATIGGILSLRVQKAYSMLFVTACLIGILAWHSPALFSL